MVRLAHWINLTTSMRLSDSDLTHIRTHTYLYLLLSDWNVDSRYTSYTRLMRAFWIINTFWGCLMLTGGRTVSMEIRINYIVPKCKSDWLFMKRSIVFDYTAARLQMFPVYWFANMYSIGSRSQVCKLYNIICSIRMHVVDL